MDVFKDDMNFNTKMHSISIVHESQNEAEFELKSFQDFVDSV